MSTALPKRIPLFPLPNVVLFPGALLPLHVFEPRYRELLRDASAGDELVGMVNLRGPEGAAPDDVYRRGCVGRIVRRMPLPDGRSNILLQGLREFDLEAQNFERSYRRGDVTWLPESEAGLPPELRKQLVERIESFATRSNSGDLRRLRDPDLGDALLVNVFAFALDIPGPEKQSLLQCDSLQERAARLVETLEFHLVAGATAPSASSSKVH